MRKFLDKNSSLFLSLLFTLSGNFALTIEKFLDVHNKYTSYNHDGLLNHIKDNNIKDNKSSEVKTTLLPPCFSSSYLCSINNVISHDSNINNIFSLIHIVSVLSIFYISQFYISQQQLFKLKTLYAIKKKRYLAYIKKTLLLQQLTINFIVSMYRKILIQYFYVMQSNFLAK